ncbi:unnamed protein product [Adineta steineri]|uniref:Uncharacterized protein n=1 Tax=Adineta steineri TaxID=433720 RepID=A0A818INW3_9BILA|nr:unnamed protein product [Adineta steineri]CAF1204550.1 unnamed protein product [Adineta steineri]CAF3530226.1 unnamed protein product [Adineta steineri]CAF4326762.1 unnamed protein product [Adineta steineri]CAF4326805.1 unnamed protein product [Adineta steineri]
MAASWLRISELYNSLNDFVCIVARIQSINSIQRTLILYDDDDSSTLNVSFINVRTPFDIQSSILPVDQFVQVYGKIIRQAGDIIRIDAQIIRKLGMDFDINEYIKGLILTRNYMSNIVENEGLTDNSGNPIRTIL